MNTDGFEQHLRRQPPRRLPAEWRDEILAAARTAQAEAERAAGARPRSLALPRLAGWREWLWPSPAAWAGLAACWLAILWLNRAAAPDAAEMAAAGANARAAAAYLALLRAGWEGELEPAPAALRRVEPTRQPTSDARRRAPLSGWACRQRLEPLDRTPGVHLEAQSVVAHGFWGRLGLLPATSGGLAADALGGLT